MTADDVTRTTWRCPGCDLIIEAIASEMTHRCPARKWRWVAFKRVDEQVSL